MESEDIMEDRSLEGTEGRSPSTFTTVPSVPLLSDLEASSSNTLLTCSCASSSLAAAATTPSRTARSRSGRSMICEELVWRM